MKGYFMENKEIELYINGDCYCNAKKPSCEAYKSCTYTIAVVDEEYNIKEIMEKRE